MLKLSRLGLSSPGADLEHFGGGGRTLEPRPLRFTPKSLADANISRRIFYSHFAYYCTFESLKN